MTYRTFARAWPLACIAGAAAFLVGADHLEPRRVCAMWQYVNPGCMAWVTTGSVSGALLCLLLAGICLLLIPAGMAILAPRPPRPLPPDMADRYEDCPW